jgi:hypothetical protein
MSHTKNETRVAIIPKTKLLASLRNNTLSNVEAIADLVDNPLDLDVDATKIQITKHPEKIIIADNGSGMNEEVLNDAMRLGSSGKEDSTNMDLGLFGMGLKNSSLAIGRCLTVITKTVTDIHYTAIYDLDEILSLGEFSIPLRPSSTDEIVEFNSITNGFKSGTVLILKKLDRISYKNDGAFINALKKHLGEVFRYFIMDAKEITVNGSRVEAVEPLKSYYTSNDTEINDQTYDFARPEGSKFSLRIKIGYLPSATKAETNRHGVNMENQGFYVLRNNRQVFRGTWFGIKTRHNNLNRIRAEIFFSGDNDDIFKINFEKNHSDLPQWFIDSLKQKVGGIINALEDRSKNESKAEQKNDDEDLGRIKEDIDSKANRIAPLKHKIVDNTEPITRRKREKKEEEKEKENTHVYPEGTIKKKRNLVDFAFAHLGGSYICNFEDIGNGALRIRWNVDHVFHNFFTEQHIETKAAFTKLLLALGRAIVTLSNETDEYAQVMDDFQLKIGDEFRKLMD